MATPGHAKDDINFGDWNTPTTVSGLENKKSDDIDFGSWSGVATSVKPTPGLL